MRYRADIDGLRAIAVLAVVLFHYHVPYVARGGFVGVDIFFVISGYLIALLLDREIRDGHYSVIRFYQRRARRIFPALFLLIFVCCLVSWFFVFPIDAKAMTSHALTSVAFVTNIANSQIGYFDQESDFNPLLHLWSLSIEEQFYIFFPVILFALHRVRLVIPGLLVILAASLAASVWMVGIDASRDFYLTQFRAWEFLVGALLAIAPLPAPRSRLLGQAAGFAGLALLLGSVVFFKAGMPFPGWTAAFPCIGAALVIWAGQDPTTGVARLLALPPMRFVGLISYSWYLWHWPVLVFFRLLRGEPQTALQTGSLLAVSVILAVLSWRFVERPFRSPSFRPSARRVFSLSGAAMAALAVVALLAGPVSAWRWNGADSALPALSFLGYDGSAQLREGTCFLTSRNADFGSFDREKCVGLRPDRPNFIIVGDSHAADLWSGFAAAYPDVNFLQSTASGCKPVVAASGTPRCTRLVNWTFNEFLPAHHVDGVILSGNWADKDLDKLRATVTALRPLATRIIVIGPIVAYDEPLPRLLALRAMLRDEDLVDRHRNREIDTRDNAFKASLEAVGATYVSLVDLMCPGAVCAVWAPDQVPILFDSDHLTRSGSRYVAEKAGRILFR